MKTPRELLLARHQDAAPKLDALRREVVAGLKTGSAPAPGAVFRALAENPVRIKIDGAFAWIRSSKPLDAGARPATPGTGVLPFPFQSLGWFAPLWRELVWPCRRTWAALASVWVVLFLINAAQEDDSPASVARARASAELFVTYPNQQKLLNELLADRMDPADADRPRRSTPRPRSETDWLFAV
jgi:hypothetical protein